MSDNSGTSSLKPSLSLIHNVSLTSIWVILTCTFRVLQWRELILTFDLHTGELAQVKHGENIEDKLLQLDAVGLLRLDSGTLVSIDIRDLLACDVMRKFVGPVWN